MASAAALLAKPRVLVPAFGIVGIGGAGYGLRALIRSDWRRTLREFLTGPGRTSRILLVLFMIFNLKNMPFAWTARIFGAMIRHRIRMRRPLPPKALFHYSISSTHTSLLETDYNFHKSNSTYFSDLDASRSHLVMHLLGPGIKLLEGNAQTGIVRDKTTGAPVPGAFGVALGSVFCSFKKEIMPYQGYEVWTRVLAWDRKWLYVVSHFVVKGKVKPAGWDGGSDWGKSGGLRAKGAVVEEAELQKYVIATAVSKYVFKLGRFTVHPAYLVEESGLLPLRPGEGWKGGDTGVGSPDELMEEDGLGDEWDWKRVEWERRKGMALAEHFAALDATHILFDGGSQGALGRFRPG